MRTLLVLLAAFVAIGVGTHFLQPKQGFPRSRKWHR